MIADKFVDLYARTSGPRDKLVAERDVVLTYALRALHDAAVMGHLAFKGGTSFGGDILYRHAWNRAGRFRLQVSLRERPTLPVTARPMKPQAYFAHLEFQPFDVRSLPVIEMAAEKVRAAFQRARVRDLYDLHRFAAMPFDGELLRHLAVLKLWQVRDPFDPDAFFERIHGGEYDWEDLRRLLRASERVDALEILRSIESRFGSLRNLSDLERQVVSDARSGRNEPLAERLRDEIRRLFGAPLSRPR